ncbi:alpha/beta hydrolase fold domain-containing protein [Advenella mimigardefordensis DPN7]|uniref:Alpha/beta hydrolase fold domain-containing protein n=1 Tax=Advenella mimigardefordensis (strain DSM 17166 / LMG 22922 / DPN7) TaxID=1247726 RepID=W0PCH3_ADVMD|nr:alpha/beta hydrolase fold domain-containing protein [Advenella mimigardefordensis DPN7]
MTARLNLDPCPSPHWQWEGHIQTIAAMKWGRRPQQPFVRQRLDTPDGDFLDIDWAGPQAYTHAAFNGQALVIFHGLEGSSQSHYAQAIGAHFVERGWMVAVAHFRGCSGEPNRLARSYFSGDSQDIDFILNQMRRQLPQAQWHATGISLGGNALLKYTGEQGQQLDWLAAVAGISVPVDLVATGMRLQTSLMGRYVYTPHFLASMRGKMQQKASAFPHDANWNKALQARTLLEFDDAYTGPVHGYRSAFDYWSRCSSQYHLHAIRVPTLLLIARNDPFIPQAGLPAPNQGSKHLLLHYPCSGGHAGFASGSGRGELTWLPQRLERFFTQHQ